jgi:truncated hemoglobin YjbI
MTTLFDKLGGIDGVTAAVEEMYTRLLADALTAPFFEKHSMARLKHHQVRFMKIAFTQIPDDLDVGAMMREKHKKLFVEHGLNETHFDKVVECFVGACQHLGVAKELIDEAVGVLGPLRVYFEQGAIEFGKKLD